MSSAAEPLHKRGIAVRNAQEAATWLVHNQDTTNLTLMLVESALHKLQWNSLDRGLKDCGLLPQRVNSWMLLQQAMACGQERLMGGSGLGPTVMQLAEAALQAKSGLLTGDSMSLLNQLSQNAEQLLGHSPETKSKTIDKVTDTLHSFQLPGVISKIQGLFSESGGWVHELSMAQLLAKASETSDKAVLKGHVTKAYENAHELAEKHKPVLDKVIRDAVPIRESSADI